MMTHYAVIKSKLANTERFFFICPLVLLYMPLGQHSEAFDQGGADQDSVLLKLVSLPP